ncbi:FAD:protein FMN transferase [Arthrobacter silvisoli]|uniref:FAD:protein FMN transferase n=1 Tax=Arthrobacter silvisoli TaxID=2291022 RepID=UPI000E2139E5|nr:FAD:protein FMN transferase [Arthrobacter silvisoli]
MAHPGWDTFAFDGIGTGWEISTPDPLAPAVRIRVLRAVEDYDLSYSRFRPDSRLVELARAAGTVSLPPHAEQLGAVFGTLYRLSGGSMTPLVGGSLEQLGYGADYALVPRGPARPAPRWEDVLRWDGSTLTCTEPVVLDVGAAGKGQLVDLLAGILRADGIADYLVDGSGDMLHAGPAPLRVGLEHPYDPAQAIGVVELGNRALCASASNRRAWGDGLHHVLDAVTGRPVDTVVATWTMAPSALEADALATALFLVEPRLLEEEFDFDWLIVFSDGRARFSPGFEGTLFT